MNHERPHAAGFRSILFEHGGDGAAAEPEFFRDLNLDQIVHSATASKQDYDLKPFFHAPLQDVASVAYRHEVMRDLEDERAFRAIAAFARQMREMREHLVQSEKRHYQRQKESWFRDAVEIYCAAVCGLLRDLARARLGSRGLKGFRGYLAGYVGSDRFVALQAETSKLKEDLASVRYCVLIRGGLVKVRRQEGEPDYSAEVERTFEKFKRGAAKDHSAKFPDTVAAGQRDVSPGGAPRRWRANLQVDRRRTTADELR